MVFIAATREPNSSAMASNRTRARCTRLSSTAMHCTSTSKQLQVSLSFVLATPKIRVHDRLTRRRVTSSASSPRKQPGTANTQKETRKTFGTGKTGMCTRELWGNPRTAKARKTHCQAQSRQTPVRHKRELKRQPDLDTAPGATHTATAAATRTTTAAKTAKTATTTTTTAAKTARPIFTQNSSTAVRTTTPGATRRQRWTERSHPNPENTRGNRNGGSSTIRSDLHRQTHLQDSRSHVSSSIRTPPAVI